MFWKTCSATFFGQLFSKNFCSKSCKTRFLNFQVFVLDFICRAWGAFLFSPLIVFFGIIAFSTLALPCFSHSPKNSPERGGQGLALSEGNWSGPPAAQYDARRGAGIFWKILVGKRPWGVGRPQARQFASSCLEAHQRARIWPAPPRDGRGHILSLIHI